MAIVPHARPQMTRDEVLRRFDAEFPRRPTYPFLIWVRGFYSKSFGAPGNDRRVYDDACFLITATGMTAYNANCDPSGVRLGSGDGQRKGMANLKRGLYENTWGFGRHRGKYEAVVQNKGPVTVTRDGDPPEDHTGMYGINFHKGGYGTTSSLGCQTIWPDQYAGWIGDVHRAFKEAYSPGGGSAWYTRPVPAALMEFAG